MGDVAMSVPILKAAVAQNENIRFSVVSKANFKPLFDDLEQVDFIEADVTGNHKGVIGLYKLFRELTVYNFDAVADLHNVIRSKFLKFFFSLSRKRIATIDKGRKEKKALTRSQNKVFKPLRSTHERYADVLRKLGLTIDLRKVAPVKKKELSSEILNLTGADNLKWIGIAPFAQYASKMYPLHLIEKVIQSLVITKKYKILLFGGGEKEIKTLKNLERKFDNTINISAKLNLKDELRLISNLDCMVSMDSANSHLAAMQGVKTITIWGVTHPYAGFTAFSQPIEHQVLPDLEKYPNIPCSVYGNKVCNGYEHVMESIPYEKVVSTIKKALAN